MTRFSLRANRFYQLNPGLNCSRLMPSVAVTGGGSIPFGSQVRARVLKATSNGNCWTVYCNFSLEVEKELSGAVRHIVVYTPPTSIQRFSVH